MYTVQCTQLIFKTNLHCVLFDHSARETMPFVLSSLLTFRPRLFLATYLPELASPQTRERWMKRFATGERQRLHYPTLPAATQVQSSLESYVCCIQILTRPYRPLFPRYGETANHTSGPTTRRAGSTCGSRGQLRQSPSISHNCLLLRVNSRIAYSQRRHWLELVLHADQEPKGSRIQTLRKTGCVG